MSERLDWTREESSWPHHASSRFIKAGRLRWHVQVLGEGPVLLLLHGTGASTHSFRDLAPTLAEVFRVVMVDLPSHGFTDQPTKRHMSMAGMAALLANLLTHLDIRPDVAVGHSAGAAILLRMALDRQIAPRRIIALNGALLPFSGLAARLYPSLAKILFLNPLTPRLFSWRARSRNAVTALIKSTGSQIDGKGLAYYQRLFTSVTHVEGALLMMANWDLQSLRRDLPRLTIPLTLIVGTLDRAVPPEVSYRVARLVRGTAVVRLEGLGHLAHEEAPKRVVAAIEEALLVAARGISA